MSERESPLEPKVATFRAEFRSTEIGPRYSGWAHFAFTSLTSLAVIAVAIWRVRAPRAVEWATVPAAFLLANLVEYFGHKGPMHHLRPSLRLLFVRHTQQHHRFFTDRAMAYESSRDFKMVLFPPVMIVFFLGAIAAPIALVLFATLGHDVGWLFVATSVGYFLTYEWLHFAYHLPETSRVGRARVLAALRRHHTLHHDPSLMSRANFNITFPIADRLFGTLARKEAR